MVSFDLKNEEYRQFFDEMTEKLKQRHIFNLNLTDIYRSAFSSLT